MQRVPGRFYPLRLVVMEPMEPLAVILQSFMHRGVTELDIILKLRVEEVEPVELLLAVEEAGLAAWGELLEPPARLQPGQRAILEPGLAGMVRRTEVILTPQEVQSAVEVAGQEQTQTSQPALNTPELPGAIVLLDAEAGEPGEVLRRPLSAGPEVVQRIWRVGRVAMPLMAEQGSRPQVSVLVPVAAAAGLRGLLRCVKVAMEGYRAAVEAGVLQLKVTRQVTLMARAAAMEAGGRFVYGPGEDLRCVRP